MAAEAKRGLRSRLVVRVSAGLAAALLLGWTILLALRIVAAGEERSRRPAEVAIVLGAAIVSDRPSPVFEQRIRHGVDLYRTGRVDKLLFTGGRASAGEAAEAIVARAWALRRGVPAEAIRIETVSQTTRQNLVEARRLMAKERLRSALIVSDPLHMKRALRMAEDLGIEAEASPTPTSRYRSWRSRAPFLLRETWFYTVYLITGQ